MSQNTPGYIPVPEESRTDRIIKVAKAFAGDLLPGGGTVAELADLFILSRMRSSYANRFQEWMEYVGAGLVRLQESVEGFNAENAFENEAFVTALLSATEAAGRTHRQEKRQALRNAVLNASLPGAPDDELEQVFIRFIRDLEPTHLRLLQFLDKPTADLSDDEFKVLIEQGSAWASRPVGGQLPSRDVQQLGSRSMGYVTARMFRAKLPDLLRRRSFVAVVVNDLRGMGLVEGEWPTGDIYEIPVRATDLGRKFLAFIKSPLPDDPPAQAVGNVQNLA